MRKETIKLFLFAGLLGLAIIYGMELSSDGIEDVNGTWNKPNQTTEQNIGVDGSAGPDDEWTLPVRTRELSEEESYKRDITARDTEDTSDYDWEEEQYGIPRNDREPLVDRVSGKTAEVLHGLSRDGIRMVVSLFDKVTG